MENFTPYTSLFGGVLLGISAMILLSFNGRVAGISGIVSGLFVERKTDWVWRIVFVVGLILGGLLFRMTHAVPATIADGINTMELENPMLLIISGLLVGVGATLGSGCTSGHGICGMARFSPRSVVATLIFMATAIVTVTVIRS